MEIAQHIIREAEEAIKAGGVVFPMQIISAPEFFIALGTDDTVLAFAVIHHQGTEYKLGTLKREKVE